MCIKNVILCREQDKLFSSSIIIVIIPKIMGDQKLLVCQDAIRWKERIINSSVET